MMGCLCGCGADNQHCYLPNRPPSPNTFFENFYAPTFADLLKSCLRRVKARREPSKRIKWRSSYGGDAQDESPPQHGKQYPRKGDRSYSPLPSPGFERFINEQSYDNSLSQMERSTSNRQYCSGLYSPPLDLYARQVREDSSQTNRREAQDSWLQTMGAILRRRAGLDGPTPPNVQHSPLESRNKSFSLESLPKPIDHPLMTMQPRAVHESARGDEQPSISHRNFLDYLQLQLDLDLPAQPEHSLAVQPSHPENNQNYPSDRYRTDPPKSPSPTDQATIRQEPQMEEMQGSVVRRLEDEQYQPNSDRMACLCGLDTHEHLHNLPSRPPSPNTLEDSWTPNFVQMSLGGESQDTIPRRHKWGGPTRSPDESRGRRIPISRLPTPSPNGTEAEVKHDSLCDSKDSISPRLGGSPICSLSKPPRIKASECREARRGLSLNNEKGAHIPLPPTKAVMHLSSSGPQDNFTSTFLPNAFRVDQPDPALSVRPAHTKSFKSDQVYLGTRSAPIYSQQDRPKRPSPVKRPRIRGPTSQTSRYPKWTKKDIRRSVERKGRVLDLADRLKEQAAISRASSPKICLCGCGGDNLHCLRPNMPPSPNTFYENFWAPNFAHMLMSRLDNVRRRLEPSKRIWWREEFGGCAPDREPLDSELRALRYIDFGDVLRTSPPPSSDDTHDLESMTEDRGKSPQKRQHSTTPHENPTRSADEAANTLIQDFTIGLDPSSNVIALYTDGGKLNNEFANHGPKPTRYQHSFARTSNPSAEARPSTSPYDPINPFGITESSSSLPRLSNPESPSKKRRAILQRHLEAMKLNENQSLGMNKYQRENAAARSPEPTVDHVLNREAFERLDKRLKSDLSLSSFHARTVRPKFRSPKSPTHYIPDRLPPLKLPDFSKRPVRHKPKVYTAEDDEQLLRSALRKVEASRLERYRLHGIPLDRGKLAVERQQSLPPSGHVKEVPSHVQEENLTNAAEGTIQMNHPVYGKIEVMKLRRRSRHGTAIYQHEDEAAEGPPSNFRGDHVKEVLSDTPVIVISPPTEERQRWKQSLYQKIEALKLRRNRRQGAAVYRPDDAATTSPPSTLHSCHDKEVPSDTQVKEIENSAEEYGHWRQSMYQKIEAMKLRRNRRQGTAIYQDDDAAVESSPSTSQSDHVDDESQTTTGDHQWRRSLYQKIEVMKLRRNRRQGTALYRDDDAAVESSSSASSGNHVDTENRTTTEEHQMWRKLVSQKIEVMKLRRNRRQGTSLYRHEDTSVNNSALTSYSNPLEMEIETSTDEQKRWRQSLYQRIEAMKLRRNGRYGTSIYQREDTAVESSNSISKVYYTAETPITTLPTLMV